MRFASQCLSKYMYLNHIWSHSHIITKNALDVGDKSDFQHDCCLTIKGYKRGRLPVDYNEIMHY